MVDDTERTHLAGTPDVIVFQQSEDDPDDYVSLMRVRPDGSAVWHVGPPEFAPDDVWVAVRFCEGFIRLNSWSGYAVDVSIEGAHTRPLSPRVRGLWTQSVPSGRAVDQPDSPHLAQAFGR